MLLFHNEGLIDLMGVKTMGASVKLPDAFGRFGTGLNYSIATILRGGGTITLYRGADRHEFGTQHIMIRGEGFDLVTLDGEPMGFTTKLGRDWEPWMVLRELGCNARDEGGDFSHTSEGRTLADFMSPGMTVIAVDWSKLDEAWKARGNLFLEGEPIYQDEKLRVLPNKSDYLYYRGIRAFKLDTPTMLTYDLLAEQALTEDRTLLGDWSAKRDVMRMILKCEDQALLESALLAGSGQWENSMNFADVATYTTPSRAFLDVAIAARESRNTSLNKSAKELLLKQMRKAVETESYVGGVYRRVQHDAFAYAIEVLAGLGMEFDDNQQFLPVAELPGEAKSMVERGIVFMHRDLLQQKSPEIALELQKRWVEVKGFYSAEQVVEALGPLLLKTHKGMADALALIEEDLNAAHAEKLGEQTTAEASGGEIIF